MMNLKGIEILESDSNKKGDLFGRLMSDLFHTLGYNEPKLNVHKAGREIDLYAEHRTEAKAAIAECKAHKDKIGGDDINKFIGSLDAEKRNIKKGSYSHDVIGYFVSLSGFKETALEQERDFKNERVILLGPNKIIDELIKGRILVSIERAIANVPRINGLSLINEISLLAYEKGWVWVIYFSNTKKQTITHYALIHAEGNLLIKELAEEIIILDNGLNQLLSGLTPIHETHEKKDIKREIENVKSKYFKYLENECGEIHFEGLPTDKETGSVKVKIENIFIPLQLQPIFNDKNELQENEINLQEGIGSILHNNNKLAILAKPGSGKSTLIKRLAIAYAFPNRRQAINDQLPDKQWFPIFIRCRELQDKAKSSITEIIENIAYRAEIHSYSKQFSLLISDVLQNGLGLLLIDGLDEISDDRNRISFVNQLRIFLATYPTIKIIVTSREAGFRIVGGILDSYCTKYTISNLSPSEIRELCIKWHYSIIDDSENTSKEANDLATLIVNDARIKILAENPLLLTTLLFVRRWAGYLPTKKNVLYHEMIKLLLVTWNVEGHEQLDIDEAEPQLAYVAYWMTTNGLQTINEKELKTCLENARSQMPEILSYTKISVPEFIKHVESRSSLLIMSGYTNLDNGLITQVYEFLHLSFQEYLTAKAIVENHLPLSIYINTPIEIIKSNIKKENWKEIIPLVAVLSKRDAKNIIEYLIYESKEEANESRGMHPEDKISPSELLGVCISYEVQISPELLAIGMEWYVKNRYKHHDFATTDVILNSKYGDTYRSVVKNKFFSKYEDKFIIALGGSLAEIQLNNNVIDINSIDYNIIHDPHLIKKIKTLIFDSSKENKCIGILTLMHFFYNPKISKEPGISIEIEEIFEELLTLIRLDDKYYYLCICWCISWCGRNGRFPDKYRADFTNAILTKWLIYDEYNTHRVGSWALFEILDNNVDIRLITELLHLKNHIIDLFNLPTNEFDEYVAFCIGLKLGISWKSGEFKQLLSHYDNNDKHRKILLQFSKDYSINI